MYKSIVIPVSFDATKNTDAALKAAQALGREGAAFTLLHVIEELPGYYARYIPEEAFSTNRGKVQKDLDALASKIPNANTCLLEGHSGRDIVSWSKANGADCIVLASHKPAFSDLLLGSTAQYVARHAGCAVHIVR